MTLFPKSGHLILSAGMDASVRVNRVINNILCIYNYKCILCICRVSCNGWVGVLHVASRLQPASFDLTLAIAHSILWS